MPEAPVKELTSVQKETLRRRKRIQTIAALRDGAPLTPADLLVTVECGHSAPLHGEWGFGAIAFLYGKPSYDPHFSADDHWQVRSLLQGILAHASTKYPSELPSGVCQDISDALYLRCGTDGAGRACMLIQLFAARSALHQLGQVGRSVLQRVLIQRAQKFHFQLLHPQTGFRVDGRIVAKHMYKVPTPYVSVDLNASHPLYDRAYALKSPP